MPPERPAAGGAARHGKGRREPPRRGSRPLGSAAEEAVRPLLRKRGFRETALIRHWHEIIGPQLARRTAPVSLSRGGVLTVRVEPAFATEFQHRSAMVMERIATTYGLQVVKRIAIRQGPVEGRNRLEPAGRSGTPPTDGVQRQAAARTADVRHAPLREALTKLGEAIGTDARRLEEG